MDSGELKKYPSLQGRKSGIYMTGDRCLYLYGNRFCEAKCELLMINSDVVTVLSDSHSSLLVYLTDDNKAGGFTVYCGGKLSLRIREFVLVYSVPLVNHEICGVISGGAELPKQDVRFTDSRLVELLTKLIHRQRALGSFTDKNFKELAQKIENDEVKAMNELYLAGEPITE